MNTIKANVAPSAEFQALLFGVVKDANGAPKILAPYGYKIAPINGKNHVVAMTATELAELRSALDGRSVAEHITEMEQLIAAGKWCYTYGPVDDCAPQGGCTACRKVYPGGAHWQCVCSDTY